MDAPLGAKRRSKRRNLASHDGPLLSCFISQQRWLEKKKTADEAAANATGMKEQWENLLNQFIVSLYPMLEALQKDLKPTLTKLFEWGKDFALTIKTWMTRLAPILAPLLKWGLILGVLGKILAPFLSIPMWLIKGRMLASGFNSGIAKGPLGPGGKVMSALSGGGKGGAGAVGGMTGAQTAMQGQAAKATGMGSMMSSLGSAAQILAIAAAMWILAKALQEFNTVEWSSLAKGGIAMVGFGIALKLLQPVLSSFGTSVWPGIAAMVALGAAVVLLGAGLFLMGQVPLANLIVGFLGLIGVLLAFSALSLTGVGWAGITLVLALGAAMLMIGGAIYIASMGISMIVDSLTNMFAVIGSNGAGLFMAGLGFMAMAAGIGILTISLITLGAASLLALPGLLILGGVTSMLTETASALASTGGSEGITKTINAINSVDTGKLEALKELSKWMSLLGATTTIKFEENLHVDGSIDLKGKDGSSMSIDFDKLTNAQKAQLSEIVFNTNKSERSHPGQY